jgi:hypothetical protein
MVPPEHLARSVAVTTPGVDLPVFFDFVFVKKPNVSCRGVLG